MPQPFRLTAPEPYELDIHEACAAALDKLLLPPAIWACYPAGANQLQPYQTARLSRLGLKRGWPDLMVGYRSMYGIELKRHGGQLSKTRTIRTRRGGLRILDGQEDVFPKLIASGAFSAIATVHSVDEMLAQLRRWEIPVRTFLA
jgi:hypothetical protein